MTQPVETTLKVKVLPRASKNALAGKENDTYKIKLTAPPVDGKANKALLQLLGKKLGRPKKDLRIISGERARLKSICIRGLSANAVERLLSGD